MHTGLNKGFQTRHRTTPEQQGQELAFVVWVAAPKVPLAFKIKSPPPGLLDKLRCKFPVQ